MDPNQQPDQAQQDLMIAPEDSLMTTDKTEVVQAILAPTPQNMQEEVNYTPPLAWGTDQTKVNQPPSSAPYTTTPLPTSLEIQTDQGHYLSSPSLVSQSTIPQPVQTVTQTTTNLIQPSKTTSPIMKTLLVGLVLILMGILLGVLAARFLPMTSGTVAAPAEPSAEITQYDQVLPSEMITPSVEVTPIPIPTATPSALLNLKWNMMTVKSPLSTFSSYRIYYPTTWSIKEYKNTAKANDAGSSSLIFQKGKATITIFQANTEVSSCSYDDSTVEGSVLSFADFRTVNKADHLWRWGTLQSGTVPTYPVCELMGSGYSNQTSIGFISLDGSDLDMAATEEFNYMLEKIIILK